MAVLLDRAPAAPFADPDLPDPPTTPLPGEEHLRVRRLLTRMAAAEPHRYVVVDAEGSPAEVAERVLAALTAVLPAPVDDRGERCGSSTGAGSAPGATITVPDEGKR